MCEKFIIYILLQLIVRQRRIRNAKHCYFWIQILVMNIHQLKATRLILSDKCIGLTFLKKITIALLGVDLFAAW